MRRGQSFTVMKMLIAGAFAMMMLAIVYYFSQSQPYVETSSQAMRQLAEFAERAPGKCFDRDGVQFLRGETISAASVGADNVYVQGIPGDAAAASGTVSVSIKADIKVPVMAKKVGGSVSVTIGQLCA